MSSEVILLGGRIYCDLIFAGLPSLPKLGVEIFSEKLTVHIGGPANTAIALRRLGLAATPGGGSRDRLFQRVYPGDARTRGPRREPHSEARLSGDGGDGRSALGRRAGTLVLRGAGRAARYEPGILEKSSARTMHVCGMGTARRHVDLIQAAKAAGMDLLIDCACESTDLTEPVTRTILGLYGLFDGQYRRGNGNDRSEEYLQSDEAAGSWRRRSWSRWGATARWPIPTGSGSMRRPWTWSR